jgi:hypothetical protein
MKILLLQISCLGFYNSAFYTDFKNLHLTLVNKSDLKEM